MGNLLNPKPHNTCGWCGKSVKTLVRANPNVCAECHADGIRQYGTGLADKNRNVKLPNPGPFFPGTVIQMQPGQFVAIPIGKKITPLPMPFPQDPAFKPAMGNLNMIPKGRAFQLPEGAEIGSHFLIKEIDSPHMPVGFTKISSKKWACENRDALNDGDIVRLVDMPGQILPGIERIPASSFFAPVSAKLVDRGSFRVVECYGVLKDGDPVTVFNSSDMDTHNTVLGTDVARRCRPDEVWTGWIWSERLQGVYHYNSPPQFDCEELPDGSVPVRVDNKPDVDDTYEIGSIFNG